MFLQMSLIFDLFRIFLIIFFWYYTHSSSKKTTDIYYFVLILVINVYKIPYNITIIFYSLMNTLY